MEKFKKFIELNYPDYKVINISKKINVRNITNYANLINDNPLNIYFITFLKEIRIDSGVLNDVPGPILELSISISI